MTLEKSAVKLGVSFATPKQMTISRIISFQTQLQKQNHDKKTILQRLSKQRNYDRWNCFRLFLIDGPSWVSGLGFLLEQSANH